MTPIAAMYAVNPNLQLSIPVCTYNNYACAIIRHRINFTGCMVHYYIDIIVLHARLLLSKDHSLICQVK